MHLTHTSATSRLRPHGVKMTSQMVPLGLIAGEGVFPLLVARGARAAGRKVICTAFDGIAWDDLKAGEYVRGSATKTAQNQYVALSVKIGPKEQKASATQAQGKAKKQ